MPKQGNTRLSVFKGREAKLNRAIFQTLALKGPQTIYSIHKQIRTQRVLKNTRYASVNKRVRVLEKGGYLRELSHEKTRAGFYAAVYDLTTASYLAILLSVINLEDIVKSDETSVRTIIAVILDALTFSP